MVYDSAGNMRSSRVFYMLDAFGHKNVHILNGGLKKWVSEGRKTESWAEDSDEKDYAYTLDQSKYKKIEQVHEAFV